MKSALLSVVLAASPAWALFGPKRTSNKGRVADPAGFAKLSHIVVLGAATDFPEAQEKLLSRIEKKWTGSNCWGVMDHGAAGRRLGLGSVPADADMEGAVLFRIPKRSDRMGVLIFGVDNWFGDFYDKHAVLKGMADSLLKIPVGKVGGGVLTLGTNLKNKGYHRAASARLYAAKSGRLLWEAKLSYGNSGDRDDGSQADIDAKRREEITEFTNFFDAALSRPANGSQCRAGAWKLNGPKAKPAVDPTIALLKALESGGPQQRLRAAGALGSPDYKKAAPKLRAALDDSDFKVRVTAIQSLGKMKDSGSVRRLLPFLQAKEPLVRGVTVEALGRIGSDRATGPLRALKENERDRRVIKKIDEALKSLEQNWATVDTDNIDIDF